MSGTRFPMKLDPWWRALLLVGGATQGNSYLEIERAAVTARVGMLYQDTIRLEDIESVEEGDWPLWMGGGWRIGFGQRLGLIGSYDGVVELRLRQASRVWRFASFTRLAVSLEDPVAFVGALNAKLEAP